MTMINPVIDRFIDLHCKRFNFFHENDKSTIKIWPQNKVRHSGKWQKNQREREAVCPADYSKALSD